MATNAAKGNNENSALSCLGSCSYYDELMAGYTNYEEFMAAFRVLVVEDDPTCLLIIKTMLQKLYQGLLICLLQFLFFFSSLNAIFFNKYS